MFLTTSTRYSRSQMHSGQHHDNIHTNYQSFKQTCSTQRNNTYCISINCWPEHSLFSWHSNNSSKTKNKLICKRVITLWSSTHISLFLSVWKRYPYFFLGLTQICLCHWSSGTKRSKNTTSSHGLRRCVSYTPTPIQTISSRQCWNEPSDRRDAVHHNYWRVKLHVVRVKKKNGQLRFVVDYRKLNAVTTQFTFPLPRLEDVFDTTGTSQVKLF